MWQFKVPRQELLIAALFAFIVYVFCVCLNKASTVPSGCSVYLSGESIRITGCEFTPEFVEYAKGLDVLRAHCKDCSCP
ncbi:TGB3 [Rose virus C]|nr:triple gene block 3 [Rose virus C]UVJ49776.1 TGB3 [Rose virus C]